jgi:hypothetical protein
MTRHCLRLIVRHAERGMTLCAPGGFMAWHAARDHATACEGFNQIIAFLLRVSAQAVLTWMRTFAKDYYEKPEPTGHTIVLQLDELLNGITVGNATGLAALVEQDHRAIKRVTRPMLGFKSCTAA